MGHDEMLYQCYIIVMSIQRPLKGYWNNIMNYYNWSILSISTIEALKVLSQKIMIFRWNGENKIADKVKWRFISRGWYLKVGRGRDLFGVNLREGSLGITEDSRACIRGLWRLERDS